MQRCFTTAQEGRDMRVSIRCNLFRLPYKIIYQPLDKIRLTKTARCTDLCIEHINKYCKVDRYIYDLPIIKSNLRVLMYSYQCTKTLAGFMKTNS